MEDKKETKEVYALLIAGRHSFSQAVQFSFDKEELEELASAINNQVGRWGSARVEKVDESIAEWNFPYRKTL